MRGPVLLGAFLALLLPIAEPAGAELSLAGVDTLDACDALARDHPRELEAYRCFLMVARRHKAHDDAARRLDVLMAVFPENHRTPLYLAVVEEDRGRERAEALYRQAAEGAEKAGDRTATVYARLNLFDLLMRKGRLDEADAELALASEQAEASGDLMLRALVRNNEGQRAYGRLDYAAALLIFRELETMVSPDSPAWMRANVFAGLGAAAWGVGQNEEAIAYYRREAEERRRLGDVYAEAQALVNAASVAGFRMREGAIVQDAEGLFRGALEAATRAGNRRAEAKAHTLMVSVTDTAVGLGHLDRAEEIFLGLEDLQELPEVYRSRGVLLARTDPPDHDRAFALLARAARLAREVGDARTRAVTLMSTARLHLDLGQRDEFVASALDALDVMVSIRDRQSDAIARARYFARWADSFGWMAGIVGDEKTSPSREDLALAFELAERMRSRVLLERLDAARVTETLAAGSPSLVRRDEVLEALTRVQRKLLQAGLPAGDRAALVTELDALEDEEARLRLEIARENPDYAAVRTPVFTTLDELQASLGEDQALLSFLCVDATDGRPGAHEGSWLFVYTRDEARSYRLPRREDIIERIGLFQGLLQRRDASVDAGAARLHRDLLGDALRDLDTEIRRLVIVPDGPLHRLPFGVLRGEGDDKVLAERYEIALAPSATTWRRWRSAEAGDAARTVMGFVDPEPPGDESVPAVERAWAPTTGVRLGPLPHARTEVRAIGRLGRGDVLVGRDASEAAVKSGDLASYRVLHFAAHALVDDERPARSAVLLTPGAETEDGLMQFREIVDLDLAGQVVVLSACNSAAGTMEYGEGVMGLAHAFFQAGARTVVGGLWPLRDDETAALVDGFYRHLGQGMTVAAALAAARAERIAEGAPAAAWAGLVVLGDGDYVPFPGGRATGRLLLWALGVVTLLVAGVVALRLRAV